MVSEAMKFHLHERYEFLECGAVAIAPGDQELGYM
jgi:hypothetical protein